LISKIFRNPIKNSQISSHDTAISGKAPTSHASSATTYGIGTASNYGHIKLSDTYSSKVSSAAAANGVGASQNALYNAYNALQTSFQAGVDSVYNAIVSAGTTPSSKSLSDVVAGISTMSTARYNAGVTAGQATGNANLSSVKINYQQVANGESGYNWGWFRFLNSSGTQVGSVTIKNQATSNFNLSFLNNY
jgi:hypothetical protein